MPIRRYIFNTLTVVSLLLLLATVGLWVRSFFGNETTLWNTTTLSVVTYNKQLWINWVILNSNGNPMSWEFEEIWLWHLVLITLALPAIWLIKWRKRRRLAMVGKCPSCGYDLTANTTGVCPECGAELESEVAQT